MDFIVPAMVGGFIGLGAAIAIYGEINAAAALQRQSEDARRARSADELQGIQSAVENAQTEDFAERNSLPIFLAKRRSNERDGGADTLE